MRPRAFDAGEQLCRAGESTDRIWLITGGLVHWLAPTTAGAGELQLRLRKGDVIGAQDAITGEPRSATVVAGISTSTLELDSADLIDARAAVPADPDQPRRHPARAYVPRQRTQRRGQRGEEIALVAGPSMQRP